MALENATLLQYPDDLRYLMIHVTYLTISVKVSIRGALCIPIKMLVNIKSNLFQLIKNSEWQRSVQKDDSINT